MKKIPIKDFISEESYKELQELKRESRKKFPWFKDDDIDMTYEEWLKTKEGEYVLFG